MYFCRKHLLICTANHCSQKGAQQVAARLRIELKRRGLDAEVMANTCDSIDLCDIGTNIVVYPDRIIYHGVQVSDIPEILASLEPGGQPVERLRLDANTPSEQQRRAFYAEVAAQEPMPSDAFLALAAHYGFDQAWAAEQAQRGFIARKPGPDGQLVVTLTSKTRNRYRLSTKPEPSA